jgi:hypothetical protein
MQVISQNFAIATSKHIQTSISHISNQHTTSKQNKLNTATIIPRYICIPRMHYLRRFILHLLYLAGFKMKITSLNKNLVKNTVRAAGYGAMPVLVLVP